MMGLEAYIAAEFIQEVDVTVKPYRGIPVYLIIFIFSQFFQIILCWDAVSCLLLIWIYKVQNLTMIATRGLI